MAYYRCKKTSNKSFAEQVTITGSYGNGVNSSNGNVYAQNSNVTVPTLGYKFADIIGTSDVGTGINIDVSGRSSVKLQGGTCSIKLHN